MILFAFLTAEGWAIVIGACGLVAVNLYTMYLTNKREEAAVKRDEAKIERERIQAEKVEAVKVAAEEAKRAAEEVKTDLSTATKAADAHAHAQDAKMDGFGKTLNTVHTNTNSMAEKLEAYAKAEGNRQGRQDERVRADSEKSPDAGVAPVLKDGAAELEKGDKVIVTVDEKISVVKKDAK